MEAKVYQKGQVVIPAILRKQYGIEAGGSVNFTPVEGGILIKPARKRKTAKEIAGIFKKYAPAKTPTKAEIKEAMAQAIAEKYERKNR